MGIPADGFSAEAMANTGFRIVDKGDKFWLEEYDYERPEWDMCDKRITTKVGPGSYKTICKSTKTGNVTDSTVTFTASGCSIETNAGCCKAHETFKKGADFQGKWRAVAITGADAHAEALGMTGEVKRQYLDGALKETFDVERLSNGCFKIKTDSPRIPGGVMVMKSGESITVDIPGMGKTVTTKEIISGDFLIAEATVDNIQSSTATTI